MAATACAPPIANTSSMPHRCGRRQYGGWTLSSRWGGVQRMRRGQPARRAGTACIRSGEQRRRPTRHVEADFLDRSPMQFADDAGHGFNADFAGELCSVESSEIDDGPLDGVAQTQIYSFRRSRNLGNKHTEMALECHRAPERNLLLRHRRALSPRAGSRRRFRECPASLPRDGRVRTLRRSASRYLVPDDRSHDVAQVI